jgi:hypothetical protein
MIVGKIVSTTKEIKMDKASEVLAIALGTIVALVFFSFLLALPAMWLWNNALVGAVDGVHEIGWLQAWGISILCNFLFKTKLSSSKK